MNASKAARGRASNHSVDPIVRKLGEFRRFRIAGRRKCGPGWIVYSDGKYVLCRTLHVPRIVLGQIRGEEIEHPCCEERGGDFANIGPSAVVKDEDAVRLDRVMDTLDAVRDEPPLFTPECRGVVVRDAQEFLHPLCVLAHLRRDRNHAVHGRVVPGDCLAAVEAGVVSRRISAAGLICLAASRGARTEKGSCGLAFTPPIFPPISASCIWVTVIDAASG